MREYLAFQKAVFGRALRNAHTLVQTHLHVEVALVVAFAIAPVILEILNNTLGDNWQQTVVAAILSGTFAILLVLIWSFLWSLCAAPYRLWKELQDQLSAERAAAEQRADRGAVQDHLSMCITVISTQITAIEATHGKNPHIIAAARGTQKSIASVLEKALGPLEGAVFSQAPSSYLMVSGLPAGSVGAKLYQQLVGQQKVLHELAAKYMNDGNR